MQKQKIILSLATSLILANSINAKDTTQLQSITVTAQKQIENIQEVPISISVFDEIAVEDKNINSVKDIANFVPNLMIYEHGRDGVNSPTIRGISAPFESLNVATGLFIDGVPVLSAWGFEDALLDIEQIEVLRGPQGTLYGKGTEAGAINIITKKPDNEFRGKILLDLAEDKKREFSLGLSGPIKKDKLYLGISASHYQKDGFVQNIITGDIVDDRKHLYGKAHIRWTPTDKIDISLIASHLKYDDGAHSMNLGKNGAIMFGFPSPENRKVSSNLKGKRDSKNDAQSLKVTYGINDELTLTSISTNWINKQDFLADFDMLPATMLHTDNNNEAKKISQEFRVNYSKDRLKWLIGLYADKTNNKIDYKLDSMNPMMAGFTNRDIDGNTYAIFSHLTYPLNEKLSLVTGLRYEKEEQKFKDNIRNFKTDESWNSFTPKLAIQYQHNSQLMTYASASKGYRSGGFNWMATDPKYYSYDQEELWSYEIGAKSIFMDNRLILNSSIYYMDISNMQVNEYITPETPYTTNAAQATAQGVEFDMKAKISDTLSVTAGLGYSDIEFNTFSDAHGEYKGNQNPFAPKYTFNIGTKYRNINGLYASADLIGNGKMYFDKANKHSRDSYKIINAKLGYEKEQYDIYLYGKNISDKEYDSEGYFGGFYTIYSAPREIGLKISYRF